MWSYKCSNDDDSIKTETQQINVTVNAPITDLTAQSHSQCKNKTLTPQQLTQQSLKMFVEFWNNFELHHHMKSSNFHEQKIGTLKKKKKHDTKLKTNKFNLSRARSRDWQTHRCRWTTTTSSPGPMEHPRRSPHPPSPAAAASHRPPARRRRRRTSRRGGRTRPGGGRGGGGSRGRRRLRRRRRARKSAAWSEKVVGVESVSVGGERVGIQRFKSFKFSTTFSFFLFSTKFALTFGFFFFFKKKVACSDFFFTLIELKIM